MLVNRLRCGPALKPALVQRLMFAGLRSIAAGLVVLTAGGDYKPTLTQCLLNVGPASLMLVCIHLALVGTLCWGGGGACTFSMARCCRQRNGSICLFHKGAYTVFWKGCDRQKKSAVMPAKRNYILDLQVATIQHCYIQDRNEWDTQTATDRLSGQR